MITPGLAPARGKHRARSGIARGMQLVVAALLACLPGLAPAASVYVDVNSANPVQDGSGGAPYHTITAAVAAASAGDHLYVAGGVYPEAVTVDKALIIEGSDALQTRIEPGGDAWSLTASGVDLRRLRFVGDGTWIGIESSRPFLLSDSQLEDFYYALYLNGVSGNTFIRRNRLLHNNYGAVLVSSGGSNYVKLENNVIVGLGIGAGVYGIDSRWRGYNNLISTFSVGVVHYLATTVNLSISYLVNNLIVGCTTGIQGHNLNAGELKVYANAIDAATPVTGVPAADIGWAVADDCGAPAGGFGVYQHDFEPGGACVNSGVFVTDPDGSAADIGPRGGPYGGPWWIDFECLAPHVFCPVDALLTWFNAHPTVRDALIWWEPGLGWRPFSQWSAALRDTFLEEFEDRWFDLPYDFPSIPSNLKVLADTDYPTTVLAQEDARALFFSLVHRSLQTELQQAVPWSVANYTASSLATLFDGKALYNSSPICLPAFTTFGSASPVPAGCTGVGLQLAHASSLPAPGHEAWTWLESQGLIGANALVSIGEMLEWSRAEMRHFAGGYDAAVFEYHWGYRGAVPARRVWEGTDPVGYHPDSQEWGYPPGSGLSLGFNRYTAGCHGTNTFYRQVLRVINIPVAYVTAAGHATPHFQVQGKYLSHGDDPYSPYAEAEYAASELLIDQITWQSWFGNANTAAASVGRRVTELAALHLPPLLLENRCDDLAAGLSNENGSVFAYLNEAYTMAQLNAMGFWASIDAEIASLGGCWYI